MMWTFHNTVLMSSICLGSELVFLLLHLAALLHNNSAASMNTTAFVLFSTWPFETHREIPVYLQQTESEFTGETIYLRIWPSLARGTERERVRVLSCLCVEGKGYSSQALKSLKGLYMSDAAAFSISLSLFLPLFFLPACFSFLSVFVSFHLSSPFESCSSRPAGFNGSVKQYKSSGCVESF